MAHDGLKQTGVHFEGVKWACQAHYGKIADYVEDSFDDYEKALQFRDKHTALGANVQIHQHKWVETFIASGWYPAKKGA